MFAGWGSRVARLRWSVLVVALVAVIGSGVWGFGVFGQLSEGGYNDPSSESARAADVAAEALGGQGGDVIAIYTPDQGTIDDAALTKRITERLGALPGSSVSAQSSYWSAEGDAKARFAAEDKSSAVAVVTLTGDDDAAKLEAFGEIAEDFTVPGARVELAGGVPLGHASSQLSTDDLVMAELISLPIVLILLLLIFGSLVAAALPVVVGGAAVLGSLGVLNAVALTHEVNSFAVNVASLLGLGMAIDYGLFMVGRFREEQANHSTPEAVRRTVATAGRTVVFSATLLMTALGGLLLFPQGFLKSLAYGGLAAVFLAALLSLTLLPAILAILGPKVDKIPIRLPGRGSSGPGSGWTKLAGFVLRRPVLVALPILGVLVLLALPITNAEFGENDERVLPAGNPSRVAIETLKTDYPQFSTDGVQIVVRGTGSEAPDVAAFTEAVGKIDGVTEVSPSGAGDTVVVLNAALESADEFSAGARDVVEELRSLPGPPSSEVLVGGATARNVDSLSAIADKLPLMIALLVGATLILMFLAFGSILLPLKAVVMSALSLGATFGILVWIFQEGHGAGLLNVTPAPLEAGIVVLMAAVVFGLSTDYEVFLLSRMVEARIKGATSAEAVTVGLARTGRVISAAALLLIVVTGAFALSSVTTMRFVGVGMIVALLLDATVVRMLLVPAVLALFGDAAWWAPGPLRRLQERAGLAEHAGEEKAPDRPDPSPVESTQVITGTIALPAAPQAAALPAGGSPATVVLDYHAVLDYLAEKEQGGGLLGEVTTRLPLVGASRTLSDSSPSPSVEPPLVHPSSVDSPPADGPSAAATPADSPSTESSADPLSADSPSADSPSTTSPADPLSVDSPSADSPSTTSPADPLSIDSPSADSPSSPVPPADSPDFSDSSDSSDSSGPVGAGNSRTETSTDEHTPAEAETPEPVTTETAADLSPISSAPVPPFTEVDDDDVQPILAEVELQIAAAAEPAPILAELEAQMAAEAEPEDGVTPTSPAEPTESSPERSPTKAEDEPAEPVDPTPAGFTPADPTSVDEAQATGAPIAETPAAQTPIDDEPAPETPAADTSATEVPAAGAPVPHGPDADEPIVVPAATPAPAPEPAVDATSDVAPESAPEPSAIEDTDRHSADAEPELPTDLTPSTAASAEPPTPAQPEADLFAWRSDPRIAGLSATGADGFGWLDRSATTADEPKIPDLPAPRPEPAARLHPEETTRQPEAPATWQPETSTPRQPEPSTSWQPEPAAPWQPEPPAPYQLPDAVLPLLERSRPENLGDWLGKAPATPNRPQSLEDAAPTSSIPHTERRPQTLEDLSTPEPKRPTRPNTLGDLASTPVSAAPEPGPAPARPAPASPAPSPASPAPSPASAAPVPAAAPESTFAKPTTQPDTDTPINRGTTPAEAPVSSGAPGHIRRPQTLDEWLNGGPTTPERPRTLSDLPTPPTESPTSGTPQIRRPKTLDDWLAGATPETGTPETGTLETPTTEPATRPATLADDLDANRSRRAGNDRAHWTSGSGENTRPASLADHPGPNQRPERKPTGDQNPDHPANQRPDHIHTTDPDPDPTPHP